MAIEPGRVKALFQTAIELNDTRERRAFLDREIGGDVELRARLDALLAAYDQSNSILDRPLAANTDNNSAAAPLIPQKTADGQSTAAPQIEPLAGLLDSVIAGRYKLRQEIGEGGMGTVYMAEQTQPVKRMVALKLIKAGMDSKTVLARFETERQALALMDHPNIAKVLDAGSTEQGRPFFVMKLVKGIPLSDYCDQHRLELGERLALFRQICSAVQHAHQKGIIHRDLKPTNILVESHDGQPVPKVIDFGLAKATSGMRLSEHSLFGAFGSIAGTPLYMAPEQAAFNALDIDTRADIYALGVILYELLTGSTPIQKETLRSAALDEMLRLIREVEPPTPSSQRATQGHALRVLGWPRTQRALPGRGPLVEDRFESSAVPCVGTGWTSPWAGLRDWSTTTKERQSRAKASRPKVRDVDERSRSARFCATLEEYQPHRPVLFACSSTGGDFGSAFVLDVINNCRNIEMIPFCCLGVESIDVSTKIIGCPTMTYIRRLDIALDGFVQIHR